jgi:hypothetical protein
MAQVRRRNSLWLDLPSLILFLHKLPFRGVLGYPYSFWACSAFLARFHKPKRGSTHRMSDSSMVRARQHGWHRDRLINNLGYFSLVYNYFCTKCDRIPSFLPNFGGKWTTIAMKGGGAAKEAVVKHTAVLQGPDFGKRHRRAEVVHQHEEKARGEEGKKNNNVQPVLSWAAGGPAG